MIDYLIGGYGADMGGTATGVGWGRSSADGRFEYRGVAAETLSPTWITVDGSRVYAALEGSSAVDVFDLAGDRLELVERLHLSGHEPCHLVIVRDRPIVACYRDGVIWMPDEAIPGTPEDHGPLPAQESSHAHHVRPLADGRILTVDLGTDRVYLHRWSGDRLIRYDEVAVPPGTGPRDLLPLPDGRIALLGEWSCEFMLLEPSGASFEIVQIMQLPGSAPGTDQAAALGLSPDGSVVFAGIRGSNRIASIAIDVDAARPVGWAPSGGNWPRHFIVDGGFVNVANQRSSTVATLRIEPDGTLTPLGEPVAVPSPTCLMPVGAASNL
ncbi:MAG: beta-propeller fold lactonase family protein [Pseudolysinimonas sp.]